MIYRAGSGLWRVGQSGVATAAGGAVLSAGAIAALVSWWALDETTGTRVDSHGSNDLTDNNTVGYTAGKQGNAADFSGAANKTLSVASNATLTLGTSDFYIGAWVQVPTTTVLYEAIALKQNEYYFSRSFATERKPYFQIGTGIAWGGYVKWGTALNNGTWYWIEGWHDVSAKTLYINVNNGTPVSAAYAETAGTNANAFFVNDAVNELLGYVDELVLMNAIPSADDRAVLYGNGNGTTYAAAVGA